MIPIKRAGYQIRIYHLSNGKAPFSQWLKSLDGVIRTRVRARIARFERGYFGDCKPVGDGVVEARFFFGSGYRVYFSVRSDEIILLLTGGDKSSQGEDIYLAKEFLKSYLESLYADKN